MIMNCTSCWSLYLTQIAHMEDIGSRKAVHVEIPNVLSQNMIAALKHIGITKLYSHQVWMLYSMTAVY